MYDEAPVSLKLTLGEICNQASSCQRTVVRASSRGRIFDRFLPLSKYSDIVVTGCGSSHHYWRAAARDLNPDAPRHPERTVLLKVKTSKTGFETRKNVK